MASSTLTASHNASKGAFSFITPCTFQLTTTLTLLLGLAVPVYLAHKYNAKKRARPAELRNSIYELLLEPEASPPRQTLVVEWNSRIITCFLDLLRKCPVPLPFIAPARPHSTPTYHHLNKMTLVSKQFKREYMDVYSRCATFNFTLDASDTRHDWPFAIGTDTLSRMRKCVLLFVATPGIVGAFDPREAPSHWLLRDKVFHSMSQMASLQSMTLTIFACGNQLWNPLWLWHFTSQAFKESPVKAFRRIDFRLEGWKAPIQPNHLARCTGGEWEWRCSDGHCVQADDKAQQPIREFCAALYSECRVCKPVTDDEGDD